MRVGILHLATLIDSVVRQADDNDGVCGDGVSLAPAKSRVQILKAKALSTAAAEAVAADSSAGAAAEEAAATAPVATTNTTMAVEGNPFLRALIFVLDRCILQQRSRNLACLFV